MGIIKRKILEPYNYIGSNKSLIYRSYYGDSIMSFNKDKYETYKEFIKNLLNKPSEVKFGEKIYLGKLSNLPRHKIKEYFQSNKLNKTSKLEQSNTIVFNKQHLQELNDIFNSDREYNKLSLKKVYFFELKDNKYLIDNCESWSNKLNDKFPFCLIINQGEKLNNKLESFLQDKISETLYVKDLYRENNITEIFSYIEYIFKNPHVNIIFDEDLIEVINEDGFELDDDYLSTLDSMFESESQDNINLALEMLSNVNIEKYSLTIALFLNKHIKKFGWGNGLSLKHNNSFKSILKYFESKNINFNDDWRIFSKNLYILHKDNPEDLKIIEEFIHQNINNYLKWGDCKNYLYIDSFNLSISK
jgi:hypothetical protein